jgi:hypothetical protein
MKAPLWLDMYYVILLATVKLLTLICIYRISKPSVSKVIPSLFNRENTGIHFYAGRKRVISLAECTF